MKNTRDGAGLVTRGRAGACATGWRCEAVGATGTARGQDALTGEPHTLALQHEPLKLFMAHAVRTWTGATLGIHDAVPRNAAVIGKGMKGVADEGGHAGKAGEEATWP